MPQESKTKFWAKPLAVAMKKWLRENNIEGFLFAEELGIPIWLWSAISAGTHIVQWMEAYALLFERTNLPEADPRTLPSVVTHVPKGGARVLSQPWSEKQWEDFQEKRARGEKMEYTGFRRKGKRSLVKPTKLLREKTSRPAFAERLAHALQVWFATSKMFKTQREFGRALETSSHSAARRLFLGEGVLRDPKVYARIYLLTGLEEADPRTLPSVKGRKLAMSQRAWEEWVESEDAKSILALKQSNDEREEPEPEVVTRAPEPKVVPAAPGVAGPAAGGLGLFEALVRDVVHHAVAEMQQQRSMADADEASKLGELAAEMQLKMVAPSEIVSAVSGAISAELSTFRGEFLASIGPQLTATVLSQIKAEQEQVAAQYREILHRECSDVAQAIIGVLETNIGPVVKLDLALQEMIAEEVAKLRVQKEEKEEKVVGVTNLAFRLQAALIDMVDAEDAERAQFLDANGEALRELLQYVQALVPDTRATDIGWLSRRLVEQLGRAMNGSPEDRERIFQKHSDMLLELWPLVDKLSMAREKRERAIQADQVGAARSLFHAGK